MYSSVRSRHLFKHFPHDLTLVVPRQAGQLENYFPAFSRLAIRITTKGLLQKIIHLTNQPLLSTSVNRSGQKPLSTIPEMIENFATADCLLAQHTTKTNDQPSTIVEIAAGRLKIHRIGKIKKTDLQTAMRAFIRV